MTADGNIRYLPPPAFEGEHSLAVNTTTYLHNTVCSNLRNSTLHISTLHNSYLRNIITYIINNSSNMHYSNIIVNIQMTLS